MDALYLVLHNAGRFGGGGTVDVTVVGENGRALVRVRDRGEGFSEEASKRAFDPFYSTTSDGLGLGLPHARKSIEGMGGQIELSNVPDGGAEVEISFREELGPTRSKLRARAPAGCERPTPGDTCHDQGQPDPAQGVEPLPEKRRGQKRRHQGLRRGGHRRPAGLHEAEGVEEEELRHRHREQAEQPPGGHHAGRRFVAVMTGVGVKGRSTASRRHAPAVL